MSDSPILAEHAEHDNPALLHHFATAEQQRDTASLERVALEIRHLQRTEVREVEEPFGGEQRGSSAMPLPSHTSALWGCVSHPARSPAITAGWPASPPAATVRWSYR